MTHGCPRSPAGVCAVDAGRVAAVPVAAMLRRRSSSSAERRGRGGRFAPAALLACALVGCATYQPASLRGAACLERCDVASVRCYQGGGGVWAMPECLPAAIECADACPDVARAR